MKLTVTDPETIRAIANDPNIGRFQVLAKNDGHIFTAGEKAILTGLVDFTEYNGRQVTITAIRKNGPEGRAYYVSGKINDHLDWTYEYRLRKIDR